jgi:hypothetical protein
MDKAALYTIQADEKQARISLGVRYGDRLWVDQTVEEQ